MFHGNSRLGLMGIAVTLALLTAVPASQAQSATAALSISRHGAMACRDFAALGADEQNALVRRMSNSAPPPSLATQAGSNIDADGQVVGSSNDGAAVAGTPLSAGELVAACQAASPDTTLKDAFSKFNYSAPTVPM